MKQPWIKFYPADWRADPALRMCSLAARGLWLEMLGVMHEAEPYGHLLINGKPVTEKQLASFVGASLREVSSLISELREAGVFDEENGIIISRRMVRDFDKALKDKENGGKGGNPKFRKEVNRGVNPKVNGEDKAHMLEARIQKPEEELFPSPSGDLTANDRGKIRADFDRLVAAYPKRAGSDPRKPAFQRFERIIKSGADPEKIIAGAAAYAKFMIATRSDPQFIKQLAPWLNAEMWLEDWNEKPRPRLTTGPPQSAFFPPSHRPGGGF